MCITSVQPSHGPKIQVQVSRVEVELLCNLMDGLLELHEGDSNPLDFVRAQRFLLEAAESLTLHQLPDELDQAQHELDHGSLDIFRIGIPTQGGCAATLCSRFLRPLGW